MHTLFFVCMILAANSNIGGTAEWIYADGNIFIKNTFAELYFWEKGVFLFITVNYVLNGVYYGSLETYAGAYFQ